MSDSKQTSDAANAANSKAAGTRVTGLTPKETSAGSFNGTVGGKPSGSSQSSNRGLNNY